MNPATRFFLVLLQIAIGWHFLYEGLTKINDDSWSSQPFLRNAKGSVALVIRWLSGDPTVVKTESGLVEVDDTDAFLARFQLKPFDPNEEPHQRRWDRYLPEPVEKEWDAYFQTFVKHYALDDATPMDDGAPPTTPDGDAEPQVPATQKVLAERKLKILKQELAQWLDHGTIEITRPYIDDKQKTLTATVPQRLAEYQSLLAAIKEEKAVEDTIGVRSEARLKRLEEEAADIRKQLEEELEGWTNKMKRGLREVLNYYQHRMSLPPEPSSAQPEWTYLPWIDHSVKWGLTAVGGLLFVGLFTRTACVAGAAFLLLFYLPHPPFPGLPPPPKAEGSYLFINKNIIEMLALLALACSQPGSRYGIDALLKSFVRRKPREAEELSPEPGPTVTVRPAEAPSEHVQVPDATTEPQSLDQSAAAAEQAENNAETESTTSSQRSD
ncbi:MAG: hypothetical protein KatS3mg105_4455 [Gemmatales bacterium]|nr:MAG: hypothetical protein KatS3mg105_4455 [Gemmatales bacterium]